MRTYLIMTALALTISSCGETKKEEKTALKIGQNNTESVTPSGTALALSGNDMMQFDKSVANEAAAAGESADWIPNDGAQVIAHTKMLGGGQTDVITFEAPEPGVYDFICSFPGHSGMMRGTLTIAP